MYYEINVALNGKHFFATADRSTRDAWSASLVMAAIRERFTAEDGYTVTCTMRENVGKQVTFDELCAAAFK